jgi:4-hydroxybenzoyl-CoA thioesterase/acyl-CoA thioester hydrolase
VSASCDYVAAVRFGDEIDVAATVAAVGRSSVSYAFTFTHAGAVVARGRVVAVHCRMHSGGRPEPVAVPAEIAARLRAYAADD